MKNLKMMPAAGMILVLVVVLISGCDLLGLADPGTGDDGPLSSDITSATVLEKGTYTLNNSVYVEADLTIPPGTTLKFADGVWMDVTTDGGLGKITAVGTVDEPIIFTSSRSTPSAGDWLGIIVHNNGSRFEYCRFQYADVALEIIGNSVTVSRCTFASNRTGVKAQGTTSGFSVTNSTFNTNRDPLLINASFDLDDSNTFTGNEHQRIEFDGSTIASARSWSETEVPIYFYNSCYVEAVLTLASGVTLAMGSGNWIDISADPSGAIIANGTATESITFTSIAAVPAAGDWSGIVLHGGGSEFQYCQFKYADTAITTNGYTSWDKGNNTFSNNNYNTDL